MRTVSLEQLPPRAEGARRRVAIGMFDGVHLGHRRVIEGSDTVLTFDPHPTVVVRPEAAPRLLTDTAAKAELISRLGVEELVVIPFDERFAQQSAEDFVERVIVERLGAERVSVGRNFRFGHRARGGPWLLEADERFETRVAPIVEVDGETVSSSRIRALLGAGEVEQAAHQLGRPFELRGEVVAGDRVGRELGFPTANIVPDERYVYPGHGIYACRAKLADGSERAAAVNIGVRPTFVSGRGVLVEAYLLDFDGDIYGSELRLEFIAWLRGERAYDSAQELARQIERDVQDVRARSATFPRR